MNTPIKKSRDTSSSRVALAIDAGFGLVKFTRRSSDGGAECDFFPSIALDAEAGEDNGADSGLRRDALNVEYDGRRYVVGKHVRDEMVANDFGRDMTDAYYDSRVYHALMRGALGYMGEERINTLVLGLPMHQYENKDRVNTLQDSYTGEIEISPGRSVQIDRAVVHPQPFGGYINLGSRLNEINAVLAQYPDSGIAALKSQKDLASLNVLIVDPGAYTLDWLLMTPTGANRKVSSAAIALSAPSMKSSRQNWGAQLARHTSRESMMQSGVGVRSESVGVLSTWAHRSTKMPSKKRLRILFANCSRVCGEWMTSLI